MFHLIRAGVIGGKTVPESVAENPLVFATLTAPSFGPVHGRRDHGRRCHPRAETGSRCPHGRPAGCLDRARRGRPAARAAAVRRLLRLRLARGLAVVGAGAVAPVHHRPAPAGRQDPRGAGQPAGRGRDGAVRQGRRVPAARRGPLPRPDPPRRPAAPPTGSRPRPPASTPTRWPSWSTGRRLGPADRARRRRRRPGHGCWRSDARSTPARCAPAAAPTTRTGR